MSNTDPTATVTGTSNTAAGTQIDLVITVPTPAGVLHPELPVVPADQPDAPPVAAGDLPPDVNVVSPGASAVPADTSTAGAVITQPTPAGEVHPDTPVVPLDRPGTAPVPAGFMAPDVPVVSPGLAGGTPAPGDPGAPAAPAAPIAIGTVVTFTYPEAGSGRPITQTGLVVGNDDTGSRVGWFDSVSDPIGPGALEEVT